MLEKGLNFIPAPEKILVAKITESEERIKRNILLKCAFSDEGGKDMIIEPFTEKSTWCPSHKLLKEKGTLDVALSTVEKITEITEQTLQDKTLIRSHNSQWVQLRNNNRNISMEEFRALIQLRNNTNIIIKPADKGGSIVIMNRSDYLHEAYRQLNDTNYYKRIPQSIKLINRQKINSILDEINSLGYITDRQWEFLTGPTEPRNRLFYMLPKIHKEKTKWTVPDQIPPGRSIVSDVNSESYRVSKYIDSFLSKVANKHPSYIKNTYEFVHKIRNMEVQTI